MVLYYFGPAESCGICCLLGFVSRKCVAYLPLFYITVTFEPGSPVFLVYPIHVSGCPYHPSNLTLIHFPAVAYLPMVLLTV